MPDDMIDEDERWIDPTTWPNAAAHPDAVATLAAAFAQILTPYARQHGSARSFAALAVESMAVAGRLLPEGGQTEHGWGMRDRTGKVYPARSEQDARELASNYAARGVEVVKQPICTGPWVAVDQPKED